MDDAIACGGRSMPISDFVRAWMAFRELHKTGRITIVFCEDGRDLAAARSAGWTVGMFGQDRWYVERMSAHPWDFYLGYGWGVDLWSLGKVVHPDRLVMMLMHQDGIGHVDEHFLPKDVDHWVSLFRQAQGAAGAWKY